MVAAEKIDNKEKVIYSLVCSFFGSRNNFELLEKRAIERLFGALDLL